MIWYKTSLVTPNVRCVPRHAHHRSFWRRICVCALVYLCLCMRVCVLLFPLAAPLFHKFRRQLCVCLCVCVLFAVTRHLGTARHSLCVCVYLYDSVIVSFSLLLVIGVSLPLFCNFIRTCGCVLVRVHAGARVCRNRVPIHSDILIFILTWCKLLRH